MFTPYGFRLNQTDNSWRWKKFIEGEYPEITSIVSLPTDVFDGILFHIEVLIFNLLALNGHYLVKHGKPRAPSAEQKSAGWKKLDVTRRDEEGRQSDMTLLQKHQKT